MINWDKRHPKPTVDCRQLSGSYFLHILHRIDLLLAFFCTVIDIDFPLNPNEQELQPPRPTPTWSFDRNMTVLLSQ